jgi:peptidoglycan/xylan/chitin deacetylase (PgdA/CDA1 family)
MLETGLIEIGAHTHTHADFRGRPFDFERDLRISVDAVQELFSQEEVSFAFPYGSRYAGFAADEMVDAARRTGVTCGLTTECATVDLHSDPFTWGRFNAFPWDTAATLAAKCSGWYGWAPRLKQHLDTTLSVRGHSAAYAAIMLEEAVSL